MENLNCNKGQMIVIMALIVAILLTGLSYVYSQNLLAGTESSITQLNFPKNEIRDLRAIVIEQLTYYAYRYPDSFLDYVRMLDEQIARLYALHGAYASIDVYDIKKDSTGQITSFKVKIIFSNVEVEYEETKVVKL